jgi:hypothetical protein
MWPLVVKVLHCVRDEDAVSLKRAVPRADLQYTLFYSDGRHQHTRCTPFRGTN